jgi:hypothetical protein
MYRMLWHPIQSLFKKMLSIGDLIQCTLNKCVAVVRFLEASRFGSVATGFQRHPKYEINRFTWRKKVFRRR